MTNPTGPIIKVNAAPIAGAIVNKVPIIAITGPNAATIPANATIIFCVVGDKA